MLIRKNTKAFKTILKLVSDCQARPDREKLIRLYITKVGHSIEERIGVESIQDESSLFYEMNYQAVLNNLKSANHQLHVSDHPQGIYFFHSANKTWDETPFEFDEAIKKEFSALPDFPAVRKKEIAAKFVLPKSKQTPSNPGGLKKKESVEKKKQETNRDKRPSQPDFKLHHQFEFTDLEKIIFRQPKMDKRDVLKYYDQVAGYILPYMKDRCLWTKNHSNPIQPPLQMTVKTFFDNREVAKPSWIQTATIRDEDDTHQMLLCNDKDHLLYYIEMGCVAFSAAPSRTKHISSPDFLVIAMEGPDLTKTREVVLAAKQILDGLQLPSGIKTDANAGLQVYIPVSSSEFDVVSNAAEYICKLIRLKMPDLITLKENGDYAYGKVSLDFSLNNIKQGLIVPYSLVMGDNPLVATPLQWEELENVLRLQDLNATTIFKRLKDTGDPFATISRKKVNAETLLEKLEQNYGFLF